MESLSPKRRESESDSLLQERKSLADPTMGSQPAKARVFAVFAGNAVPVITDRAGVD
ncbi:MAG TPA: hypothetical protein VFG69_15330 [Nannocystaceae bacterium]|nr:hypothetical protein [Nannocystaceae bacterium]